MSKANNHPLLKRMKGMFIYKDIVFANWTTESRVQTIEKEFEFFDDDIIIASYPKSGGDIIENIVYLILNKGKDETFKSTDARARVPYLEEERKVIYPDKTVPQFPLDYLPDMPRPRMIKTHLSYSILQPHIDQKKLRVIIPIRNPKDTLTSNFSFYTNNKEYLGNIKIPWDDYFKMWMDGCSPGGDWLKIVGDWWKLREKPNILIVRYEDIWESPRQVIKNIAKLLGEPSWEIFVQDIITTIGINDAFKPDDLDLDFMKNEETSSWKSVFSNENDHKFNDVYNSKLYQLKIKFNYDL